MVYPFFDIFSINERCTNDIDKIINMLISDNYRAD